MTGVVLRCPNCGTTKSSSGECEACHEAQVRYFCMSHNPGLWLDGPRCGQCGAVFGKRSLPASPSAAPATGRTTPVPVSARPVPVRLPSRMPGSVPAEVRRTPDLDLVPIKRGMGCLLRLMLMVFFLFLLLIASLVFTAGSFFQIFRF